MIPSHDRNHAPDPSANALVGSTIGTTMADRAESRPQSTGGGGLFDETSLMQRVRDAETLSGQYMQMAHRTAWTRAYKAYRNEHFDGSKYLSDTFRSRSKIFRPKTRSAVRKNMASAAEALFATQDVIQIQAQNEADELQVASAAIKHELMNYRLTRSSGKAGIPWFQISMGARQDSQLTGVCISKQSWLYKEDPTGKVVMDRPDITLFEPENVLIDPAANWVNPAQSGAYLILRTPMNVDDVVDMMDQRSSRTPWLDVDRETLRQYSASPIDAMQTRRARQGGVDNKDRSVTGNTFGIVWVYEVFMRLAGQEYVWWTVEGRQMLARPILVEEAYPAFAGERPVQIGFGSLDAHQPIPLSPVETWQQLQQEANDIANLRLDHLKQVVSPVTKVKRGRMVDLAQVQKRGPNGVIMVKELDDVEFDKPPDVPASAHTESAYINNDFDDLAGAFNQASVQGNRQLNETVGGMRLLSGSANSMTEFDLRVWVETWVEPVLIQVLKLEEFHENDATILAVAGERAQLWQKFGIDQITDHLLMQDVLCRVNVGTGAGTSDPLMKLKKLQAAAETVGTILGPFIESGKVDITPDAHAIVTEAFGAAGFKDGGDRFFVNPDDPARANEPEKPPPPPPPEVMMAQQKMQQADQAFQAEEARKEQAHQQRMQQEAEAARRKAEREQLDSDTHVHSEITRAHQRENDVRIADQKVQHQTAAQEQELAAARTIAQLRVKAEEEKLAAQRRQMDLDEKESALKSRELDMRGTELENQRLKLENERAKLENERLALEVQREKLEAERRMIAHREEADRVAIEESKKQAKQKTSSLEQKVKTDAELGEVKKKAAKAKAATAAKSKGKP